MFEADQLKEYHVKSPRNLARLDKRRKLKQKSIPQNPLKITETRSPSKKSGTDSRNSSQQPRTPRATLPTPQASLPPCTPTAHPAATSSVDNYLVSPRIFHLLRPESPDRDTLRYSPNPQRRIGSDSRGDTRLAPSCTRNSRAEAMRRTTNRLRAQLSRMNPPNLNAPVPPPARGPRTPSATTVLGGAWASFSSAQSRSRRAFAWHWVAYIRS